MTRHLDELDRQIGNRIRTYRLRRGISQEKLGDALGLTFQQVQKYEHGTNAVASTRVPALCKVLRITPADLFDKVLEGGSDAMPVMSVAAVKVALDFERLDHEGRRIVTAFVNSVLQSHTKKPT